MQPALNVFVLIRGVRFSVVGSIRGRPPTRSRGTGRTDGALSGQDLNGSRPAAETAFFLELARAASERIHRGHTATRTWKYPMTLRLGSLDMNTAQSIEEARRVWDTNIASIPAIRKRRREEREDAIRREDAELEELIRTRRVAAALAIYYALDHGASKTALREVTTKDHYGFESYVTLGVELAREAGA